MGLPEIRELEGDIFQVAEMIFKNGVLVGEEVRPAPPPRITETGIIQ